MLNLNYYKMKKLLWLAVIAVAAFSCKDDDEKNVNVNGTWIETSLTVTGCNDDADNESATDTDGCDDGDCTTYVFNNGTVTVTETADGDEYEIEVPYTIKGSTIDILGQKVTAKRSGNTLTLTTKDEDDGCTTVTVMTLAE
jgi:hypothetical protein